MSYSASFTLANNVLDALSAIKAKYDEASGNNNGGPATVKSVLDSLSANAATTHGMLKANSKIGPAALDALQRVAQCHQYVALAVAVVSWAYAQHKKAAESDAAALLLIERVKNIEPALRQLGEWLANRGGVLAATANDAVTVDDATKDVAALGAPLKRLVDVLDELRAVVDGWLATSTTSADKKFKRFKTWLVRAVTVDGVRDQFDEKERALATAMHDVELVLHVRTVLKVDSQFAKLDSIEKQQALNAADLNGWLREQRERDAEFKALVERDAGEIKAELGGMGVKLDDVDKKLDMVLADAARSRMHRLDFASLDIDKSAPLGQGGFGAVYSGLYNGVEHVAVKVLDFDGSHTTRDKTFDTFQNEYAAAVAANSKYIVRIYGICTGKNDAPPYHLVMELMHESLDKLVHDHMREFGEKQRLLVCRDVAKGLAMLHKANVLHRDLKPANVLIDEYVSVAKLTDFGLAKMKQFASNSTTKAVVASGTLRYMAPESMGLRPKFATQSDMFAFAILCWCVCVISMRRR
jgi:hypothetical protein